MSRLGRGALLLGAEDLRPRRSNPKGRADDDESQHAAAGVLGRASVETGPLTRA